MSFGKYTIGNPKVIWGDNSANLVVGNFCSFGENVTIYLSGDVSSNFISTYPFNYIYKNSLNMYYDDTTNNIQFKNYPFKSNNNVSLSNYPSTSGNVTIGNDVWVGDNVTIVSGVTIGNGSIINSNSCVTGNISAYSIAGGNPATFIKYRFTTDQINTLESIAWWNWTDDKINSLAPFISNVDIDELETQSVNYDTNV